MKTAENIYQFENLYNFRDIGGFKTKDGCYVKTGILFRSDELSRLSQKDVESFHQINIKSICDLRTLQEQQSKVSRIQTGNEIQLLNVSIHDKSREFTHLEFFKFLVSKSNTIDFEKIMKEMYDHMAFGCYKEINEVITFLSNPKNLPALIHCTGGKDRTGFISALIQLLVGVPYETVINEYLLSNQLIAKRMKKVETFIRWMSLFQVSSERVKPILEVRRDYFEEVYNKIIEQYGDIENYLRLACKVPQSNLENLKQLLIE
ncbi:tyrosine-protein phosphatase [Priestia aryabhattai]|uniref:tyrosine-protein phosphatase n=1 Tax=Priestia aryabhattai TaxID=412384 RepID=UPI003D2BCFA9